jgi:hypothetical protein
MCPQAAVNKAIVTLSHCDLPLRSVGMGPLEKDASAPKPSTPGARRQNSRLARKIDVCNQTIVARAPRSKDAKKVSRETHSHRPLENAVNRQRQATERSLVGNSILLGRS